MVSIKSLKNFLLGGAFYRVSGYVKLICKCREDGKARLAWLLSARLNQKYGVFLSSRAIIPASTRMPHPTSIVVGEGVKLGESVTIYQNVTLGGARRGDWAAGNYPQIGEGTTIFAGAVIVGAVSIGKHCVIGANSVVTKDVPDYSTAVGAPARVLNVDPKEK